MSNEVQLSLAAIQAGQHHYHADASDSAIRALRCRRQIHVIANVLPGQLAALVGCRLAVMRRWR